MSILIDKPKSFFTTHQDWTFPVPIAYGPGRLMEIGEKCSLLGIKNPLIVTDKGSADLPFIEKLETYLSKSNISNFFIKIFKKDNELAFDAIVTL